MTFLLERIASPDYHPTPTGARAILLRPLLRLWRDGIMAFGLIHPEFPMSLPAGLLGLLESCKKQPEEDTPRLILADWLDDHGEPQRGELVRLQCTLGDHHFHDITWPNHDAAEREEDLLAEHGRSWLGAWDRPGWGSRLSRGLVSLHVSPELLVLAANQLAEHDGLPWVETIRFSGSGSPPLEVFNCPRLANISKLSLWQRRVGVRVVRALERSSVLENLTQLDLSWCEMKARPAQELAASTRLRQLMRLDLAGNHFTFAGWQALADSPHLERLRHLNLANNRLGPREIEALVKSSWYPGLHRLDLSRNPILDRGAEALAAARPAPELTHLDLTDAEIGEAGMEALSGSPLLAHVRNLQLTYNRISAEGAEQLARSSYLGAVTSLDIGGWHFGDAGVEKLIGARLPRLRSFDIAYNDFSLAGAEYLAKANFLPALTFLNVSCNKVGDKGTSTLLDALGEGNLEALDLASNDLGADAWAPWRLHLCRSGCSGSISAPIEGCLATLAPSSTALAFSG